MKKTSNKRGSRLVNVPVQGRFVLRLLCYWVCYHVALFHAVFVFRILSHRLDVAGGGTLLLPLGDLYREFFHEQQFLLFCAAAAFPIVARDVILWSHRVVGPLIRFQRVLEQLTRGEKVRSVHLRKGDLLVDFQKTFNAYLAVLSETPHEASESAGPVADGTTGAEPEQTLLRDVSSLRAAVVAAPQPAAESARSSPA